MFPADHRTFNQTAATGRSSLVKMQLLLVELPDLAVKDQQAVRDEFMRHYDAITKLESMIYGKDSRTAASDAGTSLESNALAQDRVPVRAPAWVRNKPADTAASRFFVGTAERPDLESAREASLRDAQDEAVRDLVREVTKRTASVDALEELRLRDIVSKARDVVETGFAVDKGRGMFTYWTLLRLNPRLFDRAVLVVREAPTATEQTRIL